MRARELVSVIAGMLLGAGVGHSAPSLADGLRFYLPFEGSAAPKYCQGMADVNLGAGFIDAGRVGQGVNIVGDASVSAPEPGNFNRPRGTVAFWHRPQWNPVGPGERDPMLLRGANFQLTWHRPKSVLFFMTGSSQAGAGFHWDYSVATQAPLKWTQPVWRHFAMTWDAATGEKRLYLDGQLAEQGKTPWIRDNAPELHDRLTLGDPGAPGLYDEWLIWDRVLEDSEIMRLAQQSEAVAGELAALRPPEPEMKSPVGFDLARLKPDETIVEPGEAFHLPTVARNRTAEPLELTLKLALVDVSGNVSEQAPQRLQLKAGEARPMRFDLHADRNGVFKLRSELAWKSRTFRTDLGAFAVWPKGRLTPSANSYFGSHVNSWYGGAFIKQAARLGLSWQRDHDMLQATWWTHVQPEPGEPRWSLDFQLDYCKAARLNALGGLSTTPYWAADPPLPKTSKTSGYYSWAQPQLDLFQKYVRMTVARHRDYIRVWEVWNEPDTAVFWKGTPEEWAQLAQAACRASKAADPTCTVLVGAFTGVVSREWLDRAGKAGAFSGADAISFHGYTGNAKQLEALVGTMHDVAARYAPKGEATEIWNTEWGVEDTTFLVDADFPDLPPRRLLPPPSFLQGAAEVVRLDCVGLALGIKRSFYYLHNDVGGPAAYHNRSMIEYTRAPRPKLMARLALESLVRDARAETVIERKQDNGLMAAVFAKGDNASLAAVWTPEKGVARLLARWPQGTEWYDLFANRLPPPGATGWRLSEAPAYVRAKVSARALADLLRGAGVTPGLETK